MDLLTGRPYWLLKHGLINVYPSIDRNVKTDVVVIGAGITGALVAYHLNKAGFEVVVLDRRHVGLGSTVGSTSLLQYEIDIPLYKLIQKVGEKNAVKSYQLCLEAVKNLLHLAQRFDGIEADARPSLQYASFNKHVEHLRSEYNARKRYKISSVRWLEADEMEELFRFNAPAGLLSKDAATLDAYQLTHALLSKCMQKGTMVWDNSPVTRIQYHKRSVEVQVKDQFNVKARYAVICCGYESQQYLPKPVEELRSTYAIISEPMSSEDLWYKNAVIWETADPYLYLRTTRDHRVIIGGMDDPHYSAKKQEANLGRKSVQLVRAFNKLFPDVNFIIDFAWSGVFCATHDGLPYIGKVRQCPHTFFTLGYGGNGIVFSLIGAEIISDLLTKGKSDAVSLFSFDR